MLSPKNYATSVFIPVELKFSDGWSKALSAKHELSFVQTQKEHLIQVLGEDRTQLRAGPTSGWSSFFIIVC